MKPFLRNVTLFATDGPNMDLTLNSVATCQYQCDFEDTILFSEVDLPEKPYTVIKIDSVGSAQASGVHYFKELPKIMKTSHVLVVDWDSWILFPEMWDDTWLEYDYIGAVWPWLPEGQNVGNSGFCLMSKRLMETVSAIDLKTGTGVMDADIGRTWRPQLEADGIKYAPSWVADRFSYERGPQRGETFGFHGFYNFHRHVPDDVMLQIIPMMGKYVARKSEYDELMKIYFEQGKAEIAVAMRNRKFEVLDG